MAYEDLSLYTEVDPGNDFSQTTTRNTATALPRNVDAYVYKNYGLNHFRDYIHHVDIHWGTCVAAGTFGVWAITNDPGSYQDMSQGQLIYLYDGGGTNDAIILRDMGTANQQLYQTGGNFDGSDFYLIIERNGTTLTCKIYSDSERTNLLDTLTITCADTAEQYALVGFSRDAAGTSVFNGYCENFDFNPPIKLAGSSGGVSSLVGRLSYIWEHFCEGSISAISSVSGSLTPIKGWISPVGHSFPGDPWSGASKIYDEYTYDDDPNSYGRSDPGDPGDWSPWIELIAPLMKETSKVRFYLSSDADMIDLDVYVPGIGWQVVLVNWAIPVFYEWWERPILDAWKTLTKARVRVRLDIGCGGAAAKFYEFDFWGELVPVINLAGSLDGQSSITGALTISAVKELAGSISAQSSLSASLDISVKLVGSVVGISGVNGALDILSIREIVELDSTIVRKIELDSPVAREIELESIVDLNI